MNDDLNCFRVIVHIIVTDNSGMVRDIDVFRHQPEIKTGHSPFVQGIFLLLKEIRDSL